MKKTSHSKLNFTKAKLAYYKKMKDGFKPIKNQKIMKKNKKNKSLELNKKSVSDLNETALNGGHAADSISFPIQACSFPLDACNIQRAK